MNCQHCGHNLNPKELDAQQGSTVPCPQCGKTTRVHYTVQDEMSDPVGALLLRDTKYAHPAIVIIGLIVFTPIVLYLCFVMLIQNDLPAAKFLAPVILVLFAGTVIQFLRRMSRNQRDIEQPSPRDSNKAADGLTGTRDS